MITITKSKTASVDVDAQKTFTPQCQDELPVTGGDEIADELNANATKASKRTGSKDAHPANPLWEATEKNPQFTKVDGNHANLDTHWKMHGVVGTFGFELIDGLPAPVDYDFMVYKGIEKDMHPYGACYHDLGNKQTTGLIEFLKCNDIDTVIVGGLATDYCVATTAKQLHSAGFSVIINLASCRGIAEDTVESAIKEMKEIGIIFVNDHTEINVA